MPEAELVGVSQLGGASGDWLVREACSVRDVTVRDEYNIIGERLCGALYIRIGIGIFPSRPLGDQS